MDTAAISKTPIDRSSLTKVAGIAWIAVWTGIGLSAAAMPVLRYIGLANSIPWFLAGGVVLGVFFAVRESRNLEFHILQPDATVAGFASVFAFAVFGIAWLIFYVLIQLSVGIIAGIAKANLSSASRIGSWISLIGAAVIGAAMVWVAVSEFVPKITAGNQQILWQKTIAKGKRIALISSIATAIAIALAWWLTSRTVLWWHLLLVQLFTIFAGTGLQETSDHDEARTKRVSRQDALTVIHKLMMASGLTVVALDKSQDPYSIGVDLLGIADKSAVAVAVVTVDQPGEGSAESRQIISATLLRSSAWAYIRHRYPRTVSSLFPEVVVAGMTPSSELREYCAKQEIELQELSAIDVIRILAEKEDHKLREWAVRIFPAQTSAPAGMRVS